ncbi:MAG: DUF4367 domain-containing protein [Oscillospiraceae bacterium]|nr:DUF4367 domain-containing protein [Oscillospiraceae bacterium]
MDEINRHDYKEYAYLRKLPIDKLLDLLAVAPALSDRPEDEAYMSALEEAISEKENENPTGFFPDVDQQWNEFVTYYMPSASETEAEPENLEHTASPQTPQPSTNAPSKRVIRFKQMRRTVLVAAAAVACMLAVMVTAQAAGVDVFGAMARWTEDVFSFGQIVPDSQVSDDPAQKTAGQETEAPDTEFASLQEALDAYGMTEVHEPGWLPEGYVLDRLDVLAMDDPFLRSFSVSYTDGKGIISIGIMNYEGEPATQVQKVDGSVESMVKDGITFYLIQNTKDWTIAWCTDQYEYYVSSKVGKDILWQVVESMFT